MRKTIIKGLYLLLTEMIAVYVIAFPVHAFQVSSSSTGYVRVATESGRIMTDEEIAMVSDGIVNARMDRGVRILSGSGVVWGGEASTPAASSPVGGGVLPAPAVATMGAEERASVEEAPPVPAGHRAKDLLAFPPGLLATPPDLR